MSRCLRLAVALSLILIPASLARAEVLLAGVQFTGTVPMPVGDIDARPLLSYGDPTQPGAFGFIQTDAMSFLDFANGITHDMTGDFSGFNSLATNGFNDWMYIGFDFAGYGLSYLDVDEAALLSSAFSPAPGVGSPDFSGYELTRVEVLGVSYMPIATNQLELSFQISFYGVPEPGSLALLSIGGLALVAGSRLRRRK